MKRFINSYLAAFTLLLAIALFACLSAGDISARAGTDLGSNGLESMYSPDGDDPDIPCLLCHRPSCHCLLYTPQSAPIGMEAALAGSYEYSRCGFTEPCQPSH